MSRSIPRSKCRRAGCLLCKPHKLTGERPISEQRQHLRDQFAEADEWTYELSDDEFDRIMGLA